jgi:hypothetical protein
MLSFKNFILVLFIIGIIIVTSEVTKMTYECPRKEIEYKYVPRSLDMDMKDSADVDKIFRTMFIYLDYNKNWRQVMVNQMV